MRQFADQIAQALHALTGVAPTEIKIEEPRDRTLGDLAVPCFSLAKAQKKAPPAIAVELAEAVTARLQGITAVATGPYINFKVERALLARTVIAGIDAQGSGYGRSDLGKGKTIVIDFSSPNIAKPMHVGHLRSTILGQALVNLHEALGYRTVGINHIGDWGSMFGGLVVAMKRWGGARVGADGKVVLDRARELGIDIEGDPVRGLLEVYQRSKRVLDPERPEHDAAFAAEAREAWRELESGRDGEIRALWRWVTEVSMRGFSRTYRRLGIRHDLVRGESFYEPFLASTFARCEQAGITEISDGATIVSLKAIDKGLAETPCLLKQRDGTTLYATRDLAALFHRWEEFRFERCLYVVGAEQKLHFRQLKAVLKRLGADFEPRVEHVDFGLLLGAGRTKLASRKGDVLVLDELLDEVVDETRRVVQEKNPELAGKDQIAEQIGIGALVFNDLKRERIKDVVFDKAEVLSFEGETGPYVQYTHARMASILRKAAASGQGGAAPDWSALADAAPVLVRMSQFPEVVRSAAQHAEPSELAQALLALSRDLSTWYVGSRVLDQEPPVTAARLALVRSCKTVLANGLRLLGVAAPEEM
jgi:arginyl-tRNA synthetase